MGWHFYASTIAPKETRRTDVCSFQESNLAATRIRINC